MPLDDQPTHSAARAHQESLRLLDEVADFLSRLPAVPVTKDLERKIREHLKSPGAATLNRRADAMVREQEMLDNIKSGLVLQGVSTFSPSGLPKLVARLCYPVLHLEAPETKDAAAQGRAEDAVVAAQALGMQLADGLKIQLGPLA